MLFPVLHPLCQLTTSPLRVLTKRPGSTGEVRGLSYTRPPTLLAQVFHLLAAPHARCLQLLKLNLSLFKMSYSQEEELGEGRSKAAADTKEAVGEPSLVLLLVFQLSIFRQNSNSANAPFLEYSNL